MANIRSKGCAATGLAVTVYDDFLTDIGDDIYRLKRRRLNIDRHADRPQRHRGRHVDSMQRREHDAQDRHVDQRDDKSGIMRTLQVLRLSPFEIAH